MTDQIEDLDVELDEEIEEAHDPKNAEQQSIASVSAAEDKGPKAPKRRGDKDGGDKKPIPAATKAVAAKAESVEFNGDFSEDLNALVESEATLSDEFKAKTAVIFEAAVKSKLSEEINRLEEEYKTQLDEEVASIKEDLVEKVDGYLNYVVENWMEDNKLAIQSGLRSEIAEDFMSKLKDLFTESYIEVPESKVDLIDELATAHEELEEEYNEVVATVMGLNEELEGYKREAIIREASKDLAETQVAKLKSLVESIDFENEEAFTSKVATIKESYFKKQTTESVIVDEADEDGESIQEEVSDTMAQYIAAIRKAKH